MRFRVFPLFLAVLVAAILASSSTLASPVYEYASIVMGSRYNVDSSRLPAMEETCDAIVQYSTEAMCYDIYDWYGSQTSRSNILSSASGNNHYYAIVFYVGHGGFEDKPGWGTTFYIWSDEGVKVYDTEIYDQSTCQNVRFAFLWSCHQGQRTGTIGGMPGAWMHTTSLPDGYDNPDGSGYAYIGFTSIAPWLDESYEPGSNPSPYKEFVKLFYHYTLIEHKTIKAALDQAARCLWNEYCWKDTYLYRTSGMRLYKDGNLVLESWV